MRDFANRLWGASIVLYIFQFFYGQILFFKVLSGLVLLYFFIFGTSRFDTVYKKIL